MPVKTAAPNPENQLSPISDTQMVHGNAIRKEGPKNPPGCVSYRCMKRNITLCAVSLLAGWFAVSYSVRAGQDSSTDGEKHEALDVRALLEKGQASGSLPEAMVIRIAACLGEPAVKASGDRILDGLLEKWEFTSKQVRRVAPGSEEDKPTGDRVESRPFDSKGLCKDLLDGKAIEIQAHKGKGPEVAMAGSPYRRGSRSIEVVWNGETILDLHETNGPFLHLYRESDARAFGELYERLANQARGAFKAKADEQGNPPDADGIVWGKVVNGLQLGISPTAGTNGDVMPLFDGTTLHVNVQVRNAGKSTVRFIPSIFGCAAMGAGAGIPVTKLILTPGAGGEPLAITYQGVNHVGDRHPLDAGDVKYYSTVLGPGKSLRHAYPVRFDPGVDRATSWQRTGGSNIVPEGKYQLKAVLILDRKESNWKGELASGSLEVNIKPPDTK